MNLPNKITVSRIILSIIILVLLTLPWYQLGINFPVFNLGGKVDVDIRYPIAGILFIIASLTDMLDGKIARKNNLVTDFGKAMDAIADKILVNGVLIVLAYNGFISVIVPVIIVTRDIAVDSIKMISGSKGKVIGASLAGKIKTVCMMSGISLMLFYNLPFELISIDVAGLLIVLATVLSVVSGIQYYLVNKDTVFAQK